MRMDKEELNVINFKLELIEAILSNYLKLNFIFNERLNVLEEKRG